MAQLEYLKKITEVIEKIGNEQSENIKAAADLCAETIASGKLVHLFGSGHSVLPVQDVFPRYGGYVGWHPLMDPRLMWNNVIGPGGARELLWIERQKGYIANFLQSYDLKEGEVMIVYSHGGLNAAPIEAAMYAKARGLKVIAVTSGDNYKKATPTYIGEDGKGYKLGDLADILLDNCCPLVDALVQIPGQPDYVGASSTVAVITISQTLASETALRLKAMGKEVHPFVSPNVVEVGPERMSEVYAGYREKVVVEMNNM